MKKNNNPDVHFLMEDINRTAKLYLKVSSVVELRVVDMFNGSKVMSRFFDCPKKLSEVAAYWSGKAKGVYITINPVNPELMDVSKNRSTTDIDVLSRAWLPLDFDPIREKGKPSTDAEHEAAILLANIVRDELTEAGWPEPVLADSGNGAHLLYPIDLPNDDKSKELVRMSLQTLSKRFSNKGVNLDTSLSNASRILKVYGTLSMKGQSTPDRPHRLSKILFVPSNMGIVTVELLLELVKTQEDKKEIVPGKRDLTVYLAGKKPKLDLILNNCTWMNHCKEDASELSEPEWYAMFSISGRCENGRELSLELSKAHNEYDQANTEQKLRQALENAGPRTCDNIESISGGVYCVECKYKGNISSPITLGKMDDDNPYKYFNDKGKFLPITLGEDILDRLPFFWDGNHFHVYDQGVYQRNEKERIQQLAQSLLKHLSRKSHVEEVMYWLKNDKYEPNENTYPDDGLINVKNGLLDWKTGELHPHTSERLSTLQLPVNYDPQASCKDIEEFISQVVPQEVIPIIYEIAGYLLLPTTKYEKAFMFTGEGANGKSTLIKLLTALIGEENTVNIPLQDLENNRFKLAQLQGKLLNTFADLAHSVLDKSSTFKAVVSGDRMSAEFKGKDSFDFIPFAKLIFSANELPSSRDVSKAFFRRWIIIHFPNSFEGKKDANLLHRLIQPQNFSGFLNLALQGLKRLELQSGFTINKATHEALEQYKRDADSVAGFIEEMCLIKAGTICGKSELYQKYNFWCLEAGLKSLGRTRFHRRLLEYCPGISEKRGKGYGAPDLVPRLWEGIQII